MLNQALLERALTWLEDDLGAPHLVGARQRFELETGPIAEGAIDYEQRIAHFLEQHLCEGEAWALVRFAAASPDLPDESRRELAGWLRSHRSLFEFTGFDNGGGALRDCVFGGTFRFWPSALDRQLAVGDRFDARLVPMGELLFLSPGRVYHPRAVHDALDALLPQLDLDAQPKNVLLNGLLAMRSRFLSFESVRAEHVYQARALAPVKLPLRRQTE
jgi:hypothetical protein